MKPSKVRKATNVPKVLDARALSTRVPAAQLPVTQVALTRVPTTQWLALLMGICTLAVAQTNVALSGDNAVPSVATDASGDASLTIAEDRSVTGSIKTSDIAGTEAHIHQGTVGNRGAAIVSLIKTGENLWTVPAGEVLTEEQYENFRAGELYVDVHSSAHPTGEIRAQLKP